MEKRTVEGNSSGKLLSQMVLDADSISPIVSSHNPCHVFLWAYILKVFGFNNKRTSKSNKKWANDLNRHFSKEEIQYLKNTWSQMLVARAYNPSYSGGRDQEDWNLKPVLGK
jgi:hypothetical protein